jgi:HPt (histidine-containing phosphotransfer) domain-containing protein
MSGQNPGDKMDTARTRLAELAAKFLERSLGDVATMRAALAVGDAASLEQIQQLAHRMVGTGATLGFETISDLAARVENLLESDGGLDEPARAQLQAGMDALDAEFGRIRGASAR